jgi:hypothetical protein
MLCSQQHKDVPYDAMLRLGFIPVSYINATEYELIVAEQGVALTGLNPLKSEFQIRNIKIQFPHHRKH